MNAPATNLATLRNPPPAAPAPDLHVDFFSSNGFELACRIARAYATSDAVPAAFRAVVEKKGKSGPTLVDNPAAIGNCLVAIEVSNSVGLSITSVMQNADVIEGKLRWSSKFQIAAVNSSRRFSPLRFNLKNLGRIKATYKEKQGWNEQKRGFDFIERTVEIDNWECVAWAYVLDGRGAPTAEVVQSIPVTMQMAVEEGWYSKSGSKWQGAMRFQMLQYRAGSFFASIYAPDVIMGMGRSAEDHYDAIDVVRQDDGVYAADAPTLQDLRSGQDYQSDQQTATQPVTADQWRPDPEEEAAIRAAELAESQRSAQQPAPRQRRERGGLGLE